MFNAIENKGLALFKAIKEKNEEEVKNILSSPFKPDFKTIRNEQGETGNLLVLADDSYPIVEALMNSYTIEIHSLSKGSALQKAIEKGHFQTFTALLENDDIDSDAIAD